MERMSLLEKLKTLNQWQLQQQLNLAKLQADVNSVHCKQEPVDEERKQILSPSSHQDLLNKENLDTEKNAYKRSSLTGTMSNNMLTNALRNIDMNNTSYKDNELVSSEQRPLKQQQKQHLQQEVNSPLNHWHMSGLQTVKFLPNIESTTTAVSLLRQNTDNRIEVSPPVSRQQHVAKNVGENPYVIEHYNTDDDQSAFSEGEFLSDVNDEDGVKPLTDTDTDTDDGSEFRRRFYAPRSNSRSGFTSDDDNRGYGNLPSLETRTNQEMSYYNRENLGSQTNYRNDNVNVDGSINWKDQMSKYLGDNQRHRTPSISSIDGKSDAIDEDNIDDMENERNPFYEGDKDETILEAEKVTTALQCYHQLTSSLLSTHC